jgi:hypothetical protein
MLSKEFKCGDNALGIVGLVDFGDVPAIIEDQPALAMEVLNQERPVILSEEGGLDLVCQVTLLDASPAISLEQAAFPQPVDRDDLAGTAPDVFGGADRQNLGDDLLLHLGQGLGHRKSSVTVAFRQAERAVPSDDGFGFFVVQTLGADFTVLDVNDVSERCVVRVVVEDVGTIALAVARDTEQVVARKFRSRHLIVPEARTPLQPMFFGESASVAKDQWAGRNILIGLLAVANTGFE